MTSLRRLKKELEEAKKLLEAADRAYWAESRKIALLELELSVLERSNRGVKRRG